MVGFNGQLTGIGSTTPVALVASSTPVHTGVRIKALAANTDVVYFGFYASASAALAGLTSSTGYQLSAGNEQAIDGGALKLQALDGYGNAQYLFFLSGSGTQAVCYWGV